MRIDCVYKGWEEKGSIKAKRPLNSGRCLVLWQTLEVHGGREPQATAFFDGAGS